MKFDNVPLDVVVVVVVGVLVLVFALVELWCFQVCFKGISLCTLLSMMI